MSALPILRLGTVKNVEGFQDHLRSLHLTLPAMASWRVGGSRHCVSR